MLEVNKLKLKRLKRVALYSHDTLGLGHIRRNLLLAETLANAPLWASVLLLSGTNALGRFRLSPGIDSISLPAYYKSASGTYEARRLGIDTKSLVTLRSRTIDTVLDEYVPDLLIVDNVPRGTRGELEPVLEKLKSRGTRCVLGLRDVLDEPKLVRDQWLGAGNERFILDNYEEVWIYGDRRVFNAVREYSMSPELASRVRYLGYLDAGRARAHELSLDCDSCNDDLHLPAGTVNLCLVGGGQDGYELASAYIKAVQPAGNVGLVVTGPFMNIDAVKQLQTEVEQRRDIRVLGFVNGVGRLINKARSVVTMGGYNTVCEVLSLGKSALIVPRVKPRREQLIRAQRLSGAGYVDMLQPEQLDPALLTEWIRTAPHRRTRRMDLDFDGLVRVNETVGKLLRTDNEEHRGDQTENVVSIGSR